MNPRWWPRVEQEIEKLLSDFSAKQRKKLDISPEKILLRKNPFLFRVRAGASATLLAQMAIDAFLSSSEETIFGNILEGIAVAVCAHAKGGTKSSAEGIDIEYTCGSERTVIQVKSGPNWGNSSQKKKMNDYFSSVKRRLEFSIRNVRCIEGICYGKSETKHLGTHIRLKGNDFWTEISDWENTHYLVMESLGTYASNGFSGERLNARNLLLSYLNDNGVILAQDKLDWSKLTELFFERS